MTSSPHPPGSVCGATPQTEPRWVTAASFARRVGAHRSTIGRFLDKLLADPQTRALLQVEEEPATGQRRYLLAELQGRWDAAPHVPAAGSPRRARDPGTGAGTPAQP